MDNTNLTGEITEDAAAPLPAYWDYKHLLAALGISLVLQFLFLPACMCAAGGAMPLFALYFDCFVLLRILLALVRKERGRGWLFYVWMLYTSPIWITVLISTLYSMFARR